MICKIVILWLIRLESDGCCRMKMRPARLVSYAFLYTTRMRSLNSENLSFYSCFTVKNHASVLV